MEPPAPRRPGAPPRTRDRPPATPAADPATGPANDSPTEPTARPPRSLSRQAPARWAGGISRSRPWYLLLAAASVLAVFATCILFSYFLIQEELNGRTTQSTTDTPSTLVPRDISSREVDPEPLTVDEVFPEDTIVINSAEPPYQVLIAKEHDCADAAADDLAVLLDQLGCSQVVRATLRSPTEMYLITGGIVNLATEADAEQAYEDIKPLVEEGTGRFLGLLAGEGTEPIVLSETVLFWDSWGHYLMYAVVARADGEPFSAADNSQANLLGWDLIEVHLRGSVLEARATQPNPELLPSVPPEPTSADPDGEPADESDDGA